MTTKTETYHELTHRLRTEVNAFPMAWAFSDNQLDEAMEKLGTTPEDCISLGAGTLIRKTDRAAFAEMFMRHEAEQGQALQNDSTLSEAILYELGNHEYIITFDATQTLEKLSLTLDDPRTLRIFNAAKKQYLDSCGFDS